MAQGTPSEILFRRQLKLILASRDLTAKELAERAGLNRCTISKFLTGRQCPKLTHLDMLCEALDCDLHALLGQ